MNKPDYIVNPVGIDRIIQECQIYLTAQLTEIEVVYGRALKTENREGKTIPEVFHSKNEYFEVLTNDKINSHLFFDVSSNRDIKHLGNTGSQYNLNTQISIIASANLKQLYPALAHRASEELIVSILAAMDSFKTKYATWKLSAIIEDTKEVLSNFNYQLSESKSNMHPFYLVAFKFDIKYNNSIC